MSRKNVEVTGAIPQDKRFDPASGVIVATDASVSGPLKRTGAGFVATPGLFGVTGHPYQLAIEGRNPVVVAELRAVWQAVSALIRSPFARAQVTVLTDSADALGFLRKWLDGVEVYPVGYQLQAHRASGKRSSLELLSEQLRYDGARYTVTKVHGHAGHQLNEAADSLARLGLRCGTRTGVPTGEVYGTATAMVSARLGDYWEQMTRQGAITATA